jgi:hypothetical protein
MSSPSAARVFQVIERDGPADRLILRERDAACAESWVIGGYRGPRLPDELGNPALVVSGRGWRLTSDEGAFDFDARAVDRVTERPALFDALHRPFALKTPDRIAVRVLLWLLRLPGGARLLRRWHANRR